MGDLTKYSRLEQYKMSDKVLWKRIGSINFYRKNDKSLDLLWFILFNMHFNEEISHFEIGNFKTIVNDQWPTTLIVTGTLLWFLDILLWSTM